MYPPANWMDRNGPGLAISLRAKKNSRINWPMKGLFTVVLLFIWCSCVDDDLRTAEEAHEELTRMITRYSANHLERCKDNALRDAEYAVDSIIREWQINPIDSLYSPVVPPRPSFVPIDSAVFIERKISNLTDSLGG